MRYHESKKGFFLFLIFFQLVFLQLPAKEIEQVSSVRNENKILATSVDFHITGQEEVLVNSTIDLALTEAWLFFDNVKPSLVLSEYRKYIYIRGKEMIPFSENENAVNCRIAVYKQGTVIIPYAPGFTPLEIFTEVDFGGESESCEVSFYYTNSPISEIPADKSRPLKNDNKIRSFKLKRGYMATFANEPDGMGYSRCFIADTEDLEMNLPAMLDEKVSFIRVFPWEWVSKKEWVGTYDKNQPEGLKYVDQQSDITNSTWYYNWGSSVSYAPDREIPLINQEFVPEKWGAGNSGSSLYTNERWSHLLGYNEPDHEEQSNVTVATAIEEWPVLMKTGARLGSPATTDFNWLYTFMEECEKRNYRVDFVVVHAYWGGQSPQSWYNDLKRVHEKTGRPIWIKEWNNGANWTKESWPDSGGSYTSANAQKQLNDLKNILQVMDTASFVERYSIYNWVEDKRAILLEGKLTLAGEYYASNTPDIAFNREKEVIPVWNMLPPELSYDYPDQTKEFVLTWKDPNAEVTGNYLIERSFDNVSWEEIGSVKFSSVASYSFSVLLPEEITGNEVYFRIKTVGVNGKEVLSNSVKYVYLNNKEQENITAGEIKIKDEWNIFFFEKELNPDAIFLAGTPTYRNKYPFSLKAKNVTPASFELRMKNWNYLSTLSAGYADTIAIMTIPEGIHHFEGITLLAGKETEVGKEWKEVFFLLLLMNFRLFLLFSFLRKEKMGRLYGSGMYPGTVLKWQGNTKQKYR